MKKRFVPDMVISDISQLKAELLHEKNIKLLLFDIDNTLVLHGKDATKETLSYVKSFKDAGIIPCFISNNSKKRVDKFNENINVFAISNAKKPLKKAYLDIMKKYDMPKENTAILGDQIFSDIWGGNAVGIYTIWVNGEKGKEPFFIKPKRWLENKLMGK